MKPEIRPLIDTMPYKVLGESIKIPSLKKGQKFVETARGSWAIFEAVEDARHIEEPTATGWLCRGKLLESSTESVMQAGDGYTHFFTSDNSGGMYAPQLYAYREAKAS